MYVEPGISIAGHVVTSFQLLIAGALLLCVAAILMGYRRDLKATLRQSGVTDRLAEDLGRIANALERIANQPADAAIRDAARKSAATIGTPVEKAPDAEPASEEAHRVAYSIFGR
jgi:membrane protein implicated in regulation of membrane protease activity